MKLSQVLTTTTEKTILYLRCGVCLRGSSAANAGSASSAARDHTAAYCDTSLLLEIDVICGALEDLTEDLKRRKYGGDRN